MDTIASQITSLTIVYSTVYSGADQRKHQSSVSLAFVRGIHWGPENSPHKWPVTRKMFPFDDVIMRFYTQRWHWELKSAHLPWRKWPPFRRRERTSHCQCHGCWWPGDERSHGLSRHDIDQIIPNNPISAPQGLRLFQTTRGFSQKKSFTNARKNGFIYE